METTEQEKTSSPPNPEGKGGFKEHPENINYGGRPKTKILTGALLQFLEEIDPQTGNPRFVDLAKKLGLMAYKGDIHAMREVFDRVEGKPPQTNQITVIESPEERVKKTIALFEQDENEQVSENSSELLQEQGGESVPSDKGSE